MQQDQNYFIEPPVGTQQPEIVLWKCPVCGWTTQGPRNWFLFNATDEYGDVAAETRACPVCLINRIKELVPHEMKIVE